MWAWLKGRLDLAVFVSHGLLAILFISSCNQRLHRSEGEAKQAPLQDNSSNDIEHLRVACTLVVRWSWRQHVWQYLG
jgi:hypothetical protein